MARTAALAALAAIAVLVTGCKHRVVVQNHDEAPPPVAAPSQPATTSQPSEKDMEDAETTACHSFVISMRAMSWKQQWFDKHHHFIAWGEPDAQADAKSLEDVYKTWIASLVRDISPELNPPMTALDPDLRSKIEKFVAASKEELAAYKNKMDSEHINDAVGKTNGALHEVGKACGTEQ
jgi:hypothetical protein